ncbi:class I adenylate-forming enzyme family protein [Natronorubrum sulfidifaciens]|uniref:Long-chain acyl-CoA synthetase n=1 Tax=Natronorubrum sulfidifaciens JCM 14089 TaxID=1230460 RepID=L9VYS8_9EURY|nr:class I adenylate-forming enzyme family protein [Natronorubrum sulfidifaciens]ELY42345.1 long-chain acyl-CoA synthetase [Natronorubrum sulfidifaciens JCM 14089]
MATIIQTLQTVTMDHQTATAIGGDDPLTFSALWSLTDGFAGGLQQRAITAGDAVAIHLSNPRAFLIAFFGTLRNGCVPVTMPADYRTDDIVSALNETECKAFVTDETPFLSVLNGADETRVAITVDCDARMGITLSAFLDNDGMNSAGSRTGIDVVRQSDGDHGLIAYVGHEDGAPLGVRYTHAALTAAASVEHPLLETDGTMRHLGSLPLSNPLELRYGATATILGGGTYLPQHHWDPETVRSLCYTDRVDRTFVSPSQFEALAALETDLAETVAVIEPTPMAGLEESDGAVTRLCGRPETGLTHVRTPTADDSPRSRHGETLPTVEHRVLEDGAELAVDTPAAMDGYVDRPALTDERTERLDGSRWIRTGVTADAVPTRP